MTRLEKLLRRWSKRDRLPQSASILCLDVGSHTTKVFTGQHLHTFPTCFIQHQPTQTVVAFGKAAVQMLGKLPKESVAVFPVRAGKVIDTKHLEIFLEVLLRDYISRSPLTFFRPTQLRVVLPVADQYPQVEVWRKVLKKWSYNVHIRPLADALWLYVKLRHVFTKEGCIVDVGGMLTKMFLYTGDQVVVGKLIEWGGDSVTLEILQSLRQAYHLEVGWTTAEALKSQVIRFDRPNRKHTVQGKDVVSGLPVTKVIEDTVFVQQREALVQQFISTFEQLCQTASPELVAKIYESGIYVTGGGSMVAGLGKELETRLKLPIHMSTTSQEDATQGLSILG